MKVSSFLLRFPLILFVLATVGMLLNIPMNPVWIFISLFVSGFLLYRDDKLFFVAFAILRFYEIEPRDKMYIEKT